MILNLLDQIGNWNPQLFREIKGRLKIGNMAIASALSLSGQLLLFMYWKAQIPVAPPYGEYTHRITDTFCTFKNIDPDSYQKKCVRDALGNFAINWQEWWEYIFVWLSILSVLALLVAGTYMLVGDLDKEGRRGTLNFIRLSPQSAKTIFIGKILGVPILLYLAVILAVPLHLYSGLAAQIPLHKILCLDTAIVASCALFYSAAMLFGLTTNWLGGFQPWLASGIALFMFGAFSIVPYSTISVWNLATFFSPLYPIVVFSDGDKLQWFYLPVGQNVAIGLALFVLIYTTVTYWLWQGWQRRFPNPGATVWSKRQSYLLVICCQIIILGFAFQDGATFNNNISGLLIFNLLMFLALIAALTPERQSLYDWARYRQQIVPSSHKLWRRYPLLDLIWSEKSPAIVAIAINLLSSVIILTPLTLFQTIETKNFWGVMCCLNLSLIYASIAQLFLFTKTRNQEIWAVGTVSSAILLPPVILSMLLITPEKAPILWLSSTFASFWSFSSITASGNTILFAILSQWTILALLNLKLRSQLKLAGESAS
ncbi:hypothetical protein, partial [Microcoleus sp. herbarium14]|uniref:hypothetical protein n=1 Tax=Microcoleus sp. herbarium14 TaxID=3055439 RepID=UPI002FD2FC0F